VTAGPGPSVANGHLRIVDEVPASFAALVAEQVRLVLADSTEDEQSFRLVLSGGATARACYERLAATSGLDWGRIECLVGDERCVPPADPDANQRMIREALVERVTPRPRFVPMDCDAPVEAYESVVAERPHLDLVHLGLGPDGHTASLFPSSVALEAPPGRLVDHNVDPAGRNPYLRLTLTLAAIARARLVVFTVAGADKHEAMARVLRNDDLPATRVRADRVVWLCDREAIGSGALGLG
jgi:6-phosphogluconolactonase